MTLDEEELKRLGYTLAREALPRKNQPVCVATPRRRCLGLYSCHGGWVSHATGEKLEGVVGWIQWPPEST
jgi:hypothetical protein